MTINIVLSGLKYIILICHYNATHTSMTWCSLSRVSYVIWPFLFQVPTSQTAAHLTLTTTSPQSAPAFQCLPSSWGQERTRLKCLLIFSDSSLAWYSSWYPVNRGATATVFHPVLLFLSAPVSVVHLQVKTFVSDSFLKTLNATMTEVTEVTIFHSQCLSKKYKD